MKQLVKFTFKITVLIAPTRSEDKIRVQSKIHPIGVLEPWFDGRKWKRDEARTETLPQMIAVPVGQICRTSFIAVYQALN
ncbi:hypothetical protein CBS63078_7951 [Aspergillus niger]|nr:hypothetical protein CBS133816_4766 [Aspergillus niger]KAI2835003.1 hypothetical protein CBS11350_10352 [Aspergillus niger]KAI2861233.1 hypothetical protein CBS12448_4933 [Aspergillus niger]KAI2877364.1 hypothetical protein CBS13152_9415 [Aspergillus niger]KAI2882607.1 hypothetical protein CBS11852_9611 [Aspergillus niger]